MKPFEPADHLHSRTFLGLLVAQFFAAFNDQAIHASAMFFAINTGTMTDEAAITWMPVLFYAPWAIFCTVAGYFADRFSKRGSLVLWKVVEVGITLLALYGFWIGRHGQSALGSSLVLSAVFLMGTHSAFFVPAKYGAMPEILTPRMLSKGNGVLESLSFLAVILGTVFGGVLSTQFLRDEYMIGVILTGLAVVGAVASLFIERMPAANPGRPFPPYVYGPLVKNIRLLLRSRPLVFAVVGIAFFTFLVAYMRQVVYMHGQSQLPRWSEAQTSYIVGMVALGIGIGSPLVGWLSGGKVEVGLVTIGAMGMILATSVAALGLANIPALVTCIIFIGFFTGFYLVPLFSLLQHRAPKTSKGDAIATSNFLNISGAIAASVLFGSIVSTAIRTGAAPPLPTAGEAITGVLTEPPEYDDAGQVERIVVDDEEYFANNKGPDYVIFLLASGVGEGEEVTIRSYGSGHVLYRRLELSGATPTPIYNKSRLPALLFVSAGAMTLAVLFVLWIILPDLLERTRIWLRTRFTQRLEVAGLLRLPTSGPAVLVTDAVGAERCDTVRGAIDRMVRVLNPERQAADREGLARQGAAILARRRVVGVSLSDGGAALLYELLRGTNAPVLPVHYAERVGAGGREVYVVAGRLLEANTPVEGIQAELDRVRDELRGRLDSGAPLEKEADAH
jgi:MFS family permease